MTTFPLRLIDRSRITTDWSCARKRFWNYEFIGKGITRSTISLPLALGIAVHDSIATIASMHKDGSVDIDAIADNARTQVLTQLLEANEGEEGAIDFANEQAALVEGQIRGFYKYVWPRLTIQYPNIIAIEQEMEYKINDSITFMSKPDLLLQDEVGGVHYIEYKTTSSKSQDWINSWNTAVQVHSTIKAVKSTLGLDVQDVTIVGLYKGYKCLVPATPVLTTDLKWVPVGSLKIGDKLVGFEENPGNNRSGGKSLREWREAEVLNIGREWLPCYELEMEDGTKITCSSGHKWLTARTEATGMGSATWKTTEELVPSKSRIIKLFEPWEGTGEIEPYEAGYMAGAFDGEGSLASMQFDREGVPYYSLGLQFTQRPNGMLQYMKNLLEKYGIKFGENGRERNDCKDLHIYGKIKVLSFLGKLQPKRLLGKLNFNKLGMIKDLPKKPVKVISKKFLGDREVVTLGTSTETLIANGFASHNSYGKQNSPYCYAYKRTGNPPFTKDEIQYDYKAGFKKYPTWELPGGTKAWVDGMPDEVLADLFPQTPPLYFNSDLVDAFFRQVREREIEIRDGMSIIGSDDPSKHLATMDAYFPQKFSECSPPYGFGCDFKDICHEGIERPLEQGYEPRTPHHAKELEMFNHEL